ncbi:MAG TPA: hypothetical protein PKD09_19945 [Aggregatilinea sp.]|uniref:hypothetical protein n=1 Tax=Aggregatilinea sp. TaxID=2806333 RepID=UPI002BCA9621|nr:hypothetical protein [Aggregatilinea sp.]HML23939.1 hypothetical protein [Aggregatilinea sp.]
MRKNKRMMVLLVVLALGAMLALAACGGDDDKEESPTATIAPTAAPVMTEAAPEPFVTVEATEEMMTEEPMGEATVDAMPAATEAMMEATVEATEAP